MLFRSFFYKIRTEEAARLRENAVFEPGDAEVLLRLSKKSKYTTADLLDLQRISFNGGVASVVQGVARTGEAPESVPEAERRLREQAGRGKWR